LFLRELAESIDRSKQDYGEGDRMVQVEEDIRFHNLIAAATGNDELRRILENINQKSVLCRLKTHSLTAIASPNCHDRIYEALMEGNHELAKQAMRDHIHFFRDAFLRAVQAEESSAVHTEEPCLVAQSELEPVRGRD
jgi:DNA-binding FadR family transcriptional regulator